ncbi:hypothetical protein BGZ68_006716 [Mortierella alpina]|nr:hypothetical protein BGZ68_006716 [Mortierella alpina]
MSSLIPRIDIHQTARHAVLVLHIPGIKPNTLSTIVSPARDCLQISYLDQSTWSKVMVTVSPQLQQPADIQGSSSALIQDCTYLPAPENTVFKFAKVQAVEWQALQLTFNSMALPVSPAEAKAEAEAQESIDNNEMDVDQNERVILEESVTLKFVTEANVGQLQNAIRASQLWESEHEQHVGNVQAKRVPGVNAIHMTAELVSNVSSSSSSSS